MKPGILTSTLISCFLITLPVAGRSAVFTVDSNGDAGVGTLRWAINLANGNAGPDVIVFDSAMTISVSSNLPALTDDETTIAGETGPVTIQNGGYGPPSVGLNVEADDCVVRGLAIQDFEQGILVSTSGGGTAQRNQIGEAVVNRGNSITANAFGIRLEGVGVEENVLHNNIVDECDSSGISLVNGTVSNFVGGPNAMQANIVMRSGLHGIYLDGAGANPCQDNQVHGNIVGTDATMMASGLGNSLSGIHLTGALCSGNTIQGNRVVANGAAGIELAGEARDNDVRNNSVGFDVTDTALPNNDGIVLSLDSRLNRIGPGNVVSGNSGYGVLLTDDGTRNNIVFGNLVGLDPSGVSALGNGADGVHVRQDAVPNTIRNNTISGNDENGIQLDDMNLGTVAVDSNRVGTDSSGMFAVPNGGHGVLIADNAVNHLITNNVLAGNTGAGLALEPTADSQTVTKNWIGVGRGGAPSIPNDIGILIRSAQNTIGGTISSGDGNHIIGNVQEGIRVRNPNANTASGNVIWGNEIESNGTDGIWFGEGAQNNGVGEFEAVVTDAGNEIRYNAGHGVRVGENGSVLDPEGNRILTNTITENTGDAIDILSSTPAGNNGIPSPTILAADATGASGITNLGTLTTTIQLFVDPADEAEAFVIEFDVTTGPNWSVSVSLTPGAHITATNTANYPTAGDPEHTSEPSAPYYVSAASPPPGTYSLFSAPEQLPEPPGGQSRATDASLIAGGNAYLVGDIDKDLGTIASVWDDGSGDWELTPLPGLAPDMPSRATSFAYDETDRFVGGSADTAAVTKPVVWQMTGEGPWWIEALPTLGAEGEGAVSDLFDPGSEPFIGSVGWSKEPAGVERAVAWMRDQQDMWMLEELGGYDPGHPSRALAGDVQNDSAAVVGWAEDASGVTLPQMWDNFGIVAQDGLPAPSGNTWTRVELPLPEDGSEGKAIGMSIPLSTIIILAGGSYTTTDGMTYGLVWHVHTLELTSTTMTNVLPPLEGYSHCKASDVGVDDTAAPTTAYVVGVSYNTMDDGRATLWTVNLAENSVLLPRAIDDLIEGGPAFTTREAAGLTIVGSPGHTRLVVSGWGTAQAAPGGGPTSHAFVLLPETMTSTPDGEGRPALRLVEAFPNPATGATSIRYSLPQDGPVRLSIHDVSGRMVATLVDGRRGAGTHSLLWPGVDAAGRRVSRGVYLVRLRSVDGIETRKLVLTR